MRSITSAAVRRKRPSNNSSIEGWRVAGQEQPPGRVAAEDRGQKRVEFRMVLAEVLRHKVDVLAGGRRPVGPRRSPVSPVRSQVSPGGHAGPDGRQVPVRLSRDRAEVIGRQRGQPHQPLAVMELAVLGLQEPAGDEIVDPRVAAGDRPTPTGRLQRRGAKVGQEVVDRIAANLPIVQQIEPRLPDLLGRLVHALGNHQEVPGHVGQQAADHVGPGAAANHAHFEVRPGQPGDQVAQAADEDPFMAVGDHDPHVGPAGAAGGLQGMDLLREQLAVAAPSGRSSRPW